MKNSLIFNFAALVCGIAIVSNVAFASPTIQSVNGSQTFNQNDAPTQLYDLKITEDLNTPEIKSGTIKISIPESLEMIFDDDRSITEFIIYGTAVDNNKVLERPAISFEDKDKSLLIPIEADFSPGEEIIITKIFVKGFHSQPLQSSELILTVGENEYFDNNYKYILSSSTQDTQEPDAPSKISLSNDESGGVLIQWEDPTDLDLNTIQILRGKNNSPISGIPYANVNAGVEEYLDSDLEEGDTAKYILRATDGRNTSTNSEEFSIVVSAEEVVIDEEEIVEAVPETDTTSCDTETLPVCGLDNVTYSNQCEAEKNNVEISYEGACLSVEFSDLDNHWGKEKIEAMALRGIVKGDPDGKFRPEDSLNRAEAAALLSRVLGNEEVTAPTNRPFTDIDVSEWYAGYIAYLKALEIIKDNPDGTYQPGEKINRAAFLSLAMHTYYYSSDTGKQTEIDSLRKDQTTDAYADLVEAWYTPDVLAATSLGFIEGRDCGNAKCFEAEATITRAEATKILFEMF